MFVRMEDKVRLNEVEPLNKIQENLDWESSQSKYCDNFEAYLE